MKRVDKRFILLLVLVLVLSTGLSYLALNHQSKKANEDISTAVKPMNIALVNEDEGAPFDGQKIAFGDAFVKSLDNDNKHDWYVVSRGVAENGLKKHIYDMMIVIPNDFSEKALSIDSKSPERVTLNYKINASGDQHVKAEAENAAIKVLNNFNKRIIDVYFASVIGNLQNAQDNIKEIVDKEAHYTNAYTNNIQQPLSGYTDRFGEVKSTAQTSKDSFGQLHDIFKNFQTQLNDNLDPFQKYSSGINQFANLKQSNIDVSKNFNDQLNLFNQAIDSAKGKAQFDNLVFANQMINNQFKQLIPQENGEKNNNIAADTADLNEYFEKNLAKLDAVEKNLSEASQWGTLRNNVQQKLNKVFDDAFGEGPIKLKELLKDPDAKIRRQMERQIRKLPTLNDQNIIGIGLSDEAEKELKNVIAVTKAYKNPDGNSNDGQKSNGFAQGIEGLKEHLKDDGVTLTDTVQNLPENKKPEQTFSLNIPAETLENYELTKLTITLPNQGPQDYCEYHPPDEIKLPSNTEGEFKVEATLHLKSTESKIDIFQPISWSWELNQTDTTNEDQPDQAQSNTAKNDTDKNQANKEVKPAEDAGTQDGDEDNPPPEKEYIKINNNYFKHQVMTGILDHAGEFVFDTISPYQKLSSLYHAYFGLNMKSDKLLEDLEKNSLTDLAKQHHSSLYYLFNEEEMKGLMMNWILDKVTKQIQDQLNALSQEIIDYKKKVSDASGIAKDLAGQVKVVTENAVSLNDNLAEILKNVDDWRAKSLALVEDNAKIQKNNDQEGTVFMTLSDDFQPLLLSSQSLAEESKGNLESANHVYQTLDEIDQTANNIEQSGTSLVANAETLSQNMANKLLNDQDFAKNFANVLANSRLGGDRENNTLYDFLSNPVQTKSAGMIVDNDPFTPYFLVVICFIVALFTAYAISTIHQRRVHSGLFDKERGLMNQNLPVTLITIGFGVLEGLIIGLLSSQLLNISGTMHVAWIVLLTFMLPALVLVSTYLLRQLKTIGMFLLLIVLSLYLFFTKGVSTSLENLTALRKVSPLEAVQTIMQETANGSANLTIAFSVIAGIILIGLLANLLVLNYQRRKEGTDDEDTVEEN
ncbi:type VII secretion protein EsaA [Camelliibacillus cellulosilyticus]|uniref:Type VII secretion system accessory factor EsaA n=1 Tax=Camelliibacillus cellulosilyticus TaxID=2174486 RepID=A0ABV9GQQ2_9BACL